MITLVVLVVVLVGLVVAVACVVEVPGVRRSRAMAERDLYAARRSRQAMELRHEIRGDVRRLRKELDRELQQLRDHERG
jgi:hypothetical protein